MTAERRLICAIYTRKSTEEGLDQNFNSLDAQRDACENFIASQKSQNARSARDTRGQKRRGGERDSSRSGAGEKGHLEVRHNTCCTSR